MSEETIGDVEERRDLQTATDFSDLRDKLVPGVVLQLEKNDIMVIKYDNEKIPPDQLNDFMKRLREIFKEHLPPNTGIRMVMVPDCLDFAVIRPPKE